MESKQAHDWDEYDSKGVGSGSYTDDTLFTRYVKGSRILEVGCGRGKMLGSLPDSFERFGMDPSAQAIATARERYPDVTFSTGDATQLVFPDAHFDTTYSIEVIEHIPDPALFLREARRVLKDGGVLYVQTPNYPVKRLYDVIYWMRGLKPTPADDYTHISPFSAKKLTRAVQEAGFTVWEVRTRNIMFENQFPFLKRARENGSRLGLLIGQKTIVVAAK